MVLRTLLTRPITLIFGLCVVLFGIGMISPSHAQQTLIRTYTTPISSVRTMPVTQAAPANTQAITPVVSTSTVILKHYSVPSGLRGDEENEGNEENESGDD